MAQTVMGKTRWKTIDTTKSHLGQSQTPIDWRKNVAIKSCIDYRLRSTAMLYFFISA
jgi:hypothetical protein